MCDSLFDINTVGSAPVPTYEGIAEEFLARMQQEGLTLTTIDKAFDNWEAPVTSAMSNVAVSTEGHDEQFGKLQDDPVPIY